MKSPPASPDELKYTFDAGKGVLRDIVDYSLTMARKVGYDNVGTGMDCDPQGEPFLWK